MEELETVGIKSFSQAVSSYVRKASLGVRILLSHRGKIVAELRQPDLGQPIGLGVTAAGKKSSAQESDLNQLDPNTQELISRGELTIGSHGGGSRSGRFPRGESLLQKVDSQTLLDELRS